MSLVLLIKSYSYRAVQAQRMARSLEFRFQKDEGLYFPSSENKGADQLCSYCTADLRLCFRIYTNHVSSSHGSYVSQQDLSTSLISINLIGLLR